MLQARRYRGAAEHLAALLSGEQRFWYRSAAPPAHLRRAREQSAAASLDPAVLGAALGSLLRMPPALDLRHILVPRVSVAERLAHLRELLGRGRFSFDDAVRGADRMTVAVTLFALLELYKAGEASWQQAEPFGDIAVVSAAAAPRAQEAR
jgi:segregation and condensation protein A